MAAMTAVAITPRRGILNFIEVSFSLNVDRTRVRNVCQGSHPTQTVAPNGRQDAS
jgi:hypothetical protein